MNPRSLYTLRVRGTYSRGTPHAAAITASLPACRFHSGAHAGSPAACSSRSWMVTLSRSAPSQAGSIEATGESRSSRPASTRRMATVAVAIGLVSEARS